MGFLELLHQCGVSHEVRRGAQGASRVVPGKSGLHATVEGERVLISSHGTVIRTENALKKDSRGLSRVAAGIPRFPRLLPVTLGNFPACL